MGSSAWSVNREGEDSGLVYRGVCMLCRDHLEMDSCCAERQCGGKILSADREVSIGPSYSLYWEEEMDIHVITY